MYVCMYRLIYREIDRENDSEKGKISYEWIVIKIYM